MTWEYATETNITRPCKLCVHSSWMGPLITFLTIMLFSKRSELSPNTLRMLRGKKQQQWRILLLCYKNRRRRGLWQQQVKTVFMQLLLRWNKPINKLFKGELRVNVMAELYRYFRKNHFGNTYSSTGCFSRGIYLTVGWLADICVFCSTFCVCAPAPSPQPPAPETGVAWVALAQDMCFIFLSIP